MAKKNKNQKPNTLLFDVCGKKTGNFYFRKFGGCYLITNDFGNHLFMSDGDFRKYVKGDIKEDHPLHWRLLESGFVRDSMDFERLVEQYRVKNIFLNQGPSLHIIVVTLRCDHRCVYCHASAKNETDVQFDMDKKTAKKVVDIIFESPSQNIAIEFQGGEPLLNWEMVKFITEYSKKKAWQKKKNLELRLVSNLSPMTDAILKYCYDHEIGISTSLDGPKILHDKNRKIAGGQSHRVTAYWLKKVNALYKKGKDGASMYLPGAILTVSRETLKYPTEIVDEYIRQGMNGIFIRPLNPYGLAKNQWRALGYTAEEYLRFYKKAVDYMILLNQKGKQIKETNASFMLVKILLGEDANYLELRSPCGAGIGQLAYNYNGDVYTCDEGRMLSMMNDETFKIGNVNENKYADFIENDITKSMCIASCLESQPLCSDCAYKPYCGICPIYNYSAQGNIFGNMPANDRCKINMGIFDYLFNKLKNDKIKMMLYNWTIKDSL